MKKKIFGAMLVVAIAVGAMMNVNLNKTSNNGDLALANVEALAQSEGGGVTCSRTCAYTGQCWTRVYSSDYNNGYCKFTGSQADHCQCS